MTLPPPITIELLRARAGVPDGTKDVELEAAFDAAFSTIETYLDRALMLSPDTLTTDMPVSHVLVRRWPIVTVDSVTWNGQAVTAGSYWFNASAGEILFAFPRGCPPLVVNWTGGYDTLPPDLVWAVLATFDQAWLTDPASGAQQGAVAAPGVQKAAITGVGSFDYGSGGSGGAMGSGTAPWGMIPASAVEVLASYANTARYGGA